MCSKRSHQGAYLGTCTLRRGAHAKEKSAPAVVRRIHRRWPRASRSPFDRAEKPSVSRSLTFERRNGMTDCPFYELQTVLVRSAPSVFGFCVCDQTPQLVHGGSASHNVSAPPAAAPSPAIPHLLQAVPSSTPQPQGASQTAKFYKPVPLSQQPQAQHSPTQPQPPVTPALMPSNLSSLADSSSPAPVRPTPRLPSLPVLAQQQPTPSQPQPQPTPALQQIQLSQPAV